MSRQRARDTSGEWLPSLEVLADQQLRGLLLQWYAQHGRSLPWRQTTDPYAIWVSEIMLQQTQVQTVIPYYQRWLGTFATVSALAAAPQEQVLKGWQGLGYYSRARYLHQGAQIIVRDYGGTIPAEFSRLMALPGVGRTTAGGILSAAFNLPYPILDGNVQRVLTRLLALPRPPRQMQAYLWQVSQALLDPNYPRQFNQALMDLGATRCRPRRPHCYDCPWEGHCLARRTHQENHLPMGSPPKSLPHKTIGVAVIWNDQHQVLIDRRPSQGLLGGLWEFPGGKLEPGETLPQCIRREVAEELGIAIAVGEHLITVDHAYSHFRVSLVVHQCRWISGDPQPLACEAVRWVSLEDLHQYPFPKANLDIIAALLKAAPQRTVGD